MSGSDGRLAVDRLRVLLLADSHLGFDHPVRPRVERRRRGLDFLANYRRVLDHARAARPDLVVHAGDLFHRSRVAAEIARLAYEPLLELAGDGIPIVLVPGNHDRARLPFPGRLEHPAIHWFDRPRTFVLRLGPARVALSGFPFCRRIAERFDDLLERAGDRSVEADLRILCLHQTVEGARVGWHDHRFRKGPEVLSIDAIPDRFAVVLAGHIHRAQTLGRPGRAIVYPGSIERTSFVERGEAKGFVVVSLRPSPAGWVVDEIDTRPLPARPMAELSLGPGEAGEASLRHRLADLDPDAIVRVCWQGDVEAAPIDAARLRALAPPTMNLEIRRPRSSGRPPAGRFEVAIGALPRACGVYLFADGDGRPLYIGKAIDLRRRVASHFAAGVDRRTAEMARQVATIEHRQTESEILALLLEDRLIKERGPIYNRRLNRAEGCVYLVLGPGPVPALRACSDPGAARPVFGPYPDERFVERIRNLLARTLAFRRCREDRPSAACPDLDLGLCAGPCVGRIDGAGYRLLVERVAGLLSGRDDRPLERLGLAMEEAAGLLRFEEAARLRDEHRFGARLVSRQRFLARFGDQDLIVLETCDRPATYRFRRGRTVERFEGHLGPEDLDRLPDPADRESIYDDPRNLLDRASIVHAWIERGDGIAGHFFV